MNGKYLCDTLEDMNRDTNKNGKVDNNELGKIKNKTCIPFGTYNVIMAFSPHFKKILPKLLNVPNFEGILIHSGNTINDTSGCILVGKNLLRGKVLNSRYYSRIINAKISKALENGEKVTITIN